MASKRSKKVKKRLKALQRRRQQHPSTRRPVTQIPPESANQVAMTTTGEILQLIRLHYEVGDVEQLRAIFASLRCLEYDDSQTRWVWLYTAEARTLPFKDRRAADNVVLGEFVFKGETDVVLNLRSFARATNALVFFDHHIPRTVSRYRDDRVQSPPQHGGSRLSGITRPLLRSRRCRRQRPGSFAANFGRLEIQHS